MSTFCRKGVHKSPSDVNSSRYGASTTFLEQVAHRNVDAPSLEAFKARLDGEPDLVGGNQPTAESYCTWMILKVLSNQGHSMVL